MAKHRLTPKLFFTGKPFRPVIRRKTPRGLSGYLPKHASPTPYSSTHRGWGR